MGGGEGGMVDKTPTFASWVLAKKVFREKRMRALLNLIRHDEDVKAALSVTPDNSSLPKVQDAIRRHAGNVTDEDRLLSENLKSVTLGWMRYTDAVTEGRKDGRYA